MIFGFIVFGLLYIFLKQTAPDLGTQNFLFIILIVALIALSLLSIASKDARTVVI